MTTEDNAVFRHSIDIQLRFNDVDTYGHVNNNAYFAYFDLGKEAYLREVLCADFQSRRVVPVIASIRADFLAPVFYGDRIAVETRIARLGTKSFTLCQRAVSRDTGQVKCAGECVMVCFDLRESRSVELPDDYRRKIAAFENLSE
ncbi:MAG: acyl-CoA thioesterase [Prevotellaceae bacterium]|nr:acyl-CoA thioesterase [Prevotellaceae bacterium]